MGVKRLKIKGAVLGFFLCLLAVYVQISVAHSATSDQDIAFDFIENVLPINPTQWRIELKAVGNAADINHLAANNIVVEDDDKALIYFLGSMVGTADFIDVFFIVRENHFIQGTIDIGNAPSYSASSRILKVANVTDFLAKYQSWSGLDSAKMIKTLSDVDLSQNSSISLSDITMNISRIDQSTKISWSLTDLRKFEVSFQKYFPTGFYDERQVTLMSTPTPTITQHPTINTGAEPPLIESLKTTLALASISSIAILSIALLVYYKKRHTKFGGET
jgi:hypothetical protein